MLTTIRGKLFTVFGTIFFLVATGTIVAERAIDLVQEQLSLIARENLPSVVTAYNVSESLTRIRTVAAAMATAESPEALAARNAALEGHIRRTLEAISELETTNAGRQRELGIENHLSDLTVLARELSETVETRLVIREHTNREIKTLTDRHLVFNDTLGPLIASETARLGEESARVAAFTDASLVRINGISLKGLIPILAISTEQAKMREAAAGAFSAASIGHLDDYWREFVRSSSVARRNIEIIRSDPSASTVVEADQLKREFDNLMSLTVGENGLFDRMRAAHADGAAQTVDLQGLDDRLEAAFNGFDRLVRLSITLLRGQTVSEGVDLNQQVSESLQAINNASVDRFGVLLELQALGNRVVGILSVAAFARGKTDLDLLREELGLIKSDAGAAFERLGGNRDFAGVVEMVAQLIGSGDGETGILALRERELKTISIVADKLFRTNALTLEMSKISAEIVANARRTTDASAAHVIASLKTSRATLLVVFGGLLLAIAGAVYYVNRSLGGRLSAFSGATLSLAEGNLRVPLPEPSGNDEIALLIRALAVFRDTAVEMEESNLREISQARQRLSDAIESISEGFALFDQDENLIVANRRYREIMFGPAASECTPGIAFAEIIEVARREQRFQRAAGDPDWARRQIERFRAGSRAFVQEAEKNTWYKVSVRKSQSGGTVVVVSDISDIKMMSNELQLAKDEAEAANEAKSAFLATMSHEIRTPLNGVVGMSRLLMGTKLNSEQHDFAATVVDAAETLLEIINDILDFSKVEAGALELEEIPIELAETVEAAVELLATKAGEKGISLACHIAPDIPRGIIGDPTRLKQILLNLLNNAVKFTDVGEVVLSVANAAPPSGAAGKTRLVFAVRDTGIGIPKDRMTRLFQSFSQVDASTTRRFGGTGLGLAISKSLVELMGGEVRVESEYGRGSTFSFELPVRIADLPVSATAQRQLKAIRNKRALVVEGNTTRREILREKLLGWGLAVEEAVTGTSAESLLETGERFDVILVDFDLQDMTGLDMLDHIRETDRGRALPAILFTSVSPADDSFWNRVRSAGHVAVLTKPPKTAHLLKNISAAVDPDSVSGADDGPAPDGHTRTPELSILLVDDNRINLKVGQKILKKNGYAADMAASGREAVEKCAGGHYDVVLMDIEMPEMDGVEASAIIRENSGDGPRPYIVALTANAMVSDRESYLDAGMDDYLSKPIDEEKLLASLRAAMLFRRGPGERGGKTGKGRS